MEVLGEKADMSGLYKGCISESDIIFSPRLVVFLLGFLVVFVVVVVEYGFFGWFFGFFLPLITFSIKRSVCILECRG